MWQLRSADLRFLIGDGEAAQVLRPAGLALLFASQPMLARTGNGAVVPIDPVFVQAVRAEELPCFPQAEASGVLAISPHSPAAQEAVAGLQAEDRLLYLPPSLQIGLHWLQRETRLRGGVPQAHLLALATLATAWVFAAPRLQAVRGAPNPSAVKLAQRLRCELGAQLANKQGLDVLAERLGCSRSTLSREFRRATGFSIARYRQELRLRCAAAQLLDDAGSCRRIADAIGCASPGQFSVDFRRLYGVSPSRAVSLIDAVIGVAAPA